MDKKQIMMISVTTKDRPGIVAEITEGISELNGNLADLRESVLCGYFTMILVASFSENLSCQEIESKLQSISLCNVIVLAHEGALAEITESDNTYILTAAGRDRMGLVAQVSRFCFDRAINILDLASNVDADRYTMMLQLDLSSINDISYLRMELEELGQQNGLKMVLQHQDIFRATNEI